MAAVKDALDPSWINAPGGVGPSYDAEELRRLQGYQLVGGAAAGTSRTGLLNPRDLALSLSGGNVMVGAGGAVIGTAKGAYVCGVAAATSIGALLAADVTNPRRDRVVLRVLDPDNGVTNGTRKAVLEILDGTPNALAATGGGFPAAPAGPFIDLGYVDVPKSGAGSPSITINAALTAAAGAPIPVRTVAERDALPKWAGLQAWRLDRNGMDYCDGTKWSEAPTAAHVEFSYATPAGAIPNNQPWGPGVLTMDIGPATTDRTIASVSGSADMISIAKPGLYAVHFNGAFGASLGGGSWFQIKHGTTAEVVATSLAIEFWGSVSAPNLRILTENTTLRFWMRQTSGAATNGAGRIRVTRIG